MDKNFAEWYRVANIEPRNEQLKMRWEGIENFLAESLDENDVFELTRLFFSSPITSDFKDKFIDLFTDIDSSFDRKNSVELSVLAGVTLIQIYNGYKDLDNLVLLSVMSISFDGQESTVPEIYQLMKTYFKDGAIGTREKILELDNAQYEIPRSETLLKLLNSEGILQWDEPLKKEFSTYITSLNSYFTKCNDFNSEYVKVCIEDSQILWWLTGNWSRDENIPFKEMQSSFYAAIIAGKELADNISIFPGPYSAKAVLYKIIKENKKAEKIEKSTIISIIDSLKKEWKNTVISKYSPEMSKDITPILTAMKYSLKVDGLKEWVPMFKKEIFDPEKLECSALEVAYQIYIECLTVKCSKCIGE